MGCMQSSYFLHLVMHKVLGDIPGVHVYADDVLLTRASVGYHHEAVGKVERRHLDMKRRLRAVSDAHGADWEQRLQGVVFSLKTLLPIGSVGVGHGTKSALHVQVSPLHLYLLPVTGAVSSCERG